MGWKLDLPRPTKGALREFRVAVWATDDLCPTSIEIQAACDQLARELRAVGAVIDAEARPDIDMRENLAVYEVMMASSAAPGGDPGVSYKTHFDRNEQRESIRRSWDVFFTEW
jgi:amidase